jgi:hypothetical protein
MQCIFALRAASAFNVEERLKRLLQTLLTLLIGRTL